MSWDILNQEINAYTERKRQLERIAAIVARHPEWFKAEPELSRLLKSISKVA